MRALEGIIAAAVTPRRLGVQDINLGVLWELIDFLGSHKVDGIILLGSTGEFVHYSNAERMRTMGLAPKRSRVPVLFNVSHSTLDGAVELAQAAGASGAAGVLLMPPHYFHYSAVEIEDYYRLFAKEAELQIPAFIYNVPMSGNTVEFETAERLLRGGVVQGVKDSGGQWDSFEQLMNLRRELGFSLFTGDDRLYARAQRTREVNGGVSGVACAVPELMVALRRALSGPSPEVATRLEARLDQFIAWCGRMPVPVCIREAVSIRGFKLGPHAIPMSGSREAIASEFREWFKAWLPEVQKECKHA